MFRRINNKNIIGHQYTIACIVIVSLLIIPFLCFTNAFAKTNTKTDSLRNVFKSVKTDTSRIKILIELSKIYNCDSTNEKINCVNEAIQLAQKVQWRKGEINARYVLGVIYSQCNNNGPAALDLFRQGLVIAKSANDTQRQSLGYILMAQTYGELNKPVQEIDCYHELLALTINPELRIGALSNLGSTYAALGNYTVALSYYDSALHTFSKLPGNTGRKRTDDTISIALLKISVGDIYLSMGDYEHASGDYKNALSLFEKTKRKAGIIIALTGLGKAYHAMKDDDAAISYYAQALDKCNNNEPGNAYKDDRLIIYNLLAKAYITKRMTDKALGYALNSQSLVQELPNSKEAPVTYNILGELYTSLKQYDKAVSYLHKAIEICKTSGALDNEKDALLTLSNTYAQMNQPARSLEAYKSYIAVRDSVYSLDKAKEVTRHEMNADFAEKQLLLNAEQDKKNAIQKAVMDQTLKRQHLAYGTFTAIIILLLVVGMLLFNRSRLRKKLEMQMAITGERSRISAEMHDDIGSELSKISLLSEIVKDNAAGSDAQSQLDIISRSSRELLDKMGEIVWSLNNKYDTLESLVIYIRRYAMEYFNVTDIDCRITMPELIPAAVIEGQVRRDIFLVVKEALHNVLKHSGGTRVAIIITTDDQSININIHDNGKGIDLPGISMFGNGLGNMKARVENVNGQFVIKNQDGTSINFNFPIPVSS